MTRRGRRGTFDLGGQSHRRGLRSTKHLRPEFKKKGFDLRKQALICSTNAEQEDYWRSESAERA